MKRNVPLDFKVCGFGNIIVETRRVQSVLLFLTDIWNEFKIKVGESADDQLYPFSSEHFDD